MVLEAFQSPRAAWDVGVAAVVAVYEAEQFDVYGFQGPKKLD